MAAHCCVIIYELYDACRYVIHLLLVSFGCIQSTIDNVILRFLSICQFGGEAFPYLSLWGFGTAGLEISEIVELLSFHDPAQLVIVGKLSDHISCLRSMPYSPFFAALLFLLPAYLPSGKSPRWSPIGFHFPGFDRLSSSPSVADFAMARPLDEEMFPTDKQVTGVIPAECLTS